MSAPHPEIKRLVADAIFSPAALKNLTISMVAEKIPLVEAFWLAAALHVLRLPVLWCMGWALPWPKSPVVTSVIEIDLSCWPRLGKAKKLFEFRDPRFNN